VADSLATLSAATNLQVLALHHQHALKWETGMRAMFQSFEWAAGSSRSLKQLAVDKLLLGGVNLSDAAAKMQGRQATFWVNFTYSPCHQVCPDELQSSVFNFNIRT
jgi:hypothetical protein